MSGNSIETARGEAEFQEEFNIRQVQSLPFRIVNTLRNYAEHAGLPVHGVFLPVSWIRDDKGLPQAREHGIQVTINVNELGSAFSKDRQFLAELKALADQRGDIELLPLIREYVEQMSYVHDHIRTRSDPSQIIASRVLNEIRAEACKLGMDGGYLMAFASADRLEPPEQELYLGDDMERSLARLKRRNQVPFANHKLVVYKT